MSYTYEYPRPLLTVDSVIFSIEDNDKKVLLIKMLIIDAFEFNKGNIPRDFTKKILMTITYIEENIMYRRITSIENTNNVLTDFDESDKLFLVLSTNSGRLALQRFPGDKFYALEYPIFCNNIKKYKKITHEHSYMIK